MQDFLDPKKEGGREALFIISIIFVFINCKFSQPEILNYISCFFFLFIYEKDVAMSSNKGCNSVLGMQKKNK